jgi:hypothetical protein
MEKLNTNLIAYNITYNRYSSSQEIPREELCNGFTIINIGDTIATINGKILFPSTTPATDQGDSFSVGGNAGEIYKGQLNLSFAVGGANPLVEVIQKFYVQIRR